MAGGPAGSRPFIQGAVLNQAGMARCAVRAVFSGASGEMWKLCGGPDSLRPLHAGGDISAMSLPPNQGN